MFGFFNKKYSLQKYNSFNVAARCSRLDVIRKPEELLTYKGWNRKDFVILGGGSNILIVDDLSIPVLKNEIYGKQIQSENSDDITIKVGAGENWHEFVLWCLSHNYGGLENLSLIPGTVGAAPLQNIGAYGVEVKSSIESVDGYDIETGAFLSIPREDCDFEYRSSIFKTTLSRNIFITAVHFKLTKKNHMLSIGYAPLKQELHIQGIEHPTIQDISRSIIKIRQSKLPDPKIIGNAGSFFKNVIVDQTKHEKLKVKYADMVAFKHNSQWKISSGWMIDALGWKGKREGDVGCHKDHALVLVNYGKATGQEIWNFALKIQADVQKHFGVLIEAEVNIWP